MKTPPRLPTRLLEAVLPPSPRGDSVLGDLHEEYERSVEAGERWAGLRYTRSALEVAIRYGWASRDYKRRRAGTGTQRLGWEGFVDSMVFNIRYAVRRLLRSPAFSLIAVLSLGLGIGANTAMFSLVNAVMIRDTPYEDPESLVDVYEAAEGFTHGTLSYPDYEDLKRESAGTFSDVAGSQLVPLQVDESGGVGMLLAEAVTGNYFELLGIPTVLGRPIGEEDYVDRGAHPVVVLSYGFWQTRFAGDPGVLGEELRLAGRPYTVVGVAPEEYTGNLRGLEPAAYVSMMMYDDLQGSDFNTLTARGNQSFFAKARLAPGATMAEAEGVVDRLTATLRAEHPRFWTPDKSFVLVPTADVIMNPMIDRVLVPAASMLMGVVGLVLLIACANLASFLLARAADRRKEIAVRLAMGARRRTLIGQLLTETVILSVLGGLLGIAMATQALAALTSADLPLPLPITLDLTLDRTVLGFSLLVSLVAGLLFGLAPAWQSTNPDVAPTLRDETAGGGRGKSAGLRNALVVGQVAVSMVLLVGAGLFLRSLDASRAIDPGFGQEPAGLLEVNAPAIRYTEDEAQLFLDDLGARIAALPGVEAVGMVDNLHLNTLSTQNLRVVVDGIDPPQGAEYHRVDYSRMDEGYLDAAGIELVAGRNFDVSDRPEGEPVAVVNETFVARFFPEGDALGRTFDVNGDETRIVGVTADTKVRQLGEAPRAFVYLNRRQDSPRFVTIVARTRGEAAPLALEMMATARSLDPEIMISKSETMERHLSVMLIGREMGALVVAGFAVLALLLASIGLYGVVSYAVSRRAREVGIRLSLGAEASDVVWMLTSSGMRLVAVGGVVGLLVSAGLSQLLSRLLYGVPALDPLTFIAVPLVLGGVAFAASWIPARRVTRISPVGALRSE